MENRLTRYPQIEEKAYDIIKEVKGSRVFRILR